MGREINFEREINRFQAQKNEPEMLFFRFFRSLSSFLLDHAPRAQPSGEWAFPVLVIKAFLSPSSRT